MDLFLLTGRSNYELFGEENTELTTSDKIKIVLFIIVRLAIMAFAAQLSWNCNKGYSFIPRVIFAFFASIFSFLYIILYYTFRSDICKKLLKK